MNLFCRLLPVSLILINISCVSDGGATDLQELNGSVNGEAWTLKMAGATRDLQRKTVEISFYSKEEIGDDPCAIAISGKNHLSIQLPYAEDNYSIPSADANLIFNFAGSIKSVNASSGFIELNTIIGNVISGYLIAEFDDDNKVEGQFRATICF